MTRKQVSDLDETTVLNRLRTSSLGRALLIVSECSSTNDIAHNAAAEGAPHGFTVVTEEQTMGRGRHGASWLSPRGGIWMTTVLRPPRVCAALNALPLIGALAIARTARASLGIQAFVRWPNDVVLNNRKVAGVLVETRFEGDRLEFALLGLGINANFHTSQLRDLAEKSVTLMDACGSPIQRAPFISSLLQEVEEIYDLARLGKTAYILRWVRQLDWSRGKRVVIRLGGSTSTGIMDGYESLTKIRLVVKQRSLLTVETDSVIAVDYVDA